jgi:hypothetical protein
LNCKLYFVTCIYNLILKRMATRLLKNVTRECLAATDTKGRTLMITLEPGDEVNVRAKGKRYSYTVSIQAIYYLALINHVTSRHKIRMAEYKQKRKDGIRCRKPSHMPRVFSPAMYEALRIK